MASYVMARPSQVEQTALESIADDLNIAGAIAEFHALASRGRLTN